MWNPSCNSWIGRRARAAMVSLRARNQKVPILGSDEPLDPVRVEG